MSKIYHFYIPCEQSEEGWRFILEHPTKEYTKEEFLELVTRIAQKLEDAGDGVPFGGVFEELVKEGFVESDTVDVSWTEMMDRVIPNKE